MDPIRVIDTHTGGEPTRIILDGFPDLGNGTAYEKMVKLRNEFDRYRNAVIQEPRCLDSTVGAIAFPSNDPDCSMGVIYFNTVGYLGMCGSGTIGLGVALAHQGKLELGEHFLETPVGKVRMELLSSNRVAFDNIASYRHLANVEVRLPNGQTVHGDVAWGGNWNFICADHQMQLSWEKKDRLLEWATQLRHCLVEQKITGQDNGFIDHVQLTSPNTDHGCDSKSFVLCPGLSYDRSPCGTGTSARLACLAGDGLLKPGETWKQESYIGSVFEASYRLNDDGTITPTITGNAYVIGESTLHFHQDDPFEQGIPTHSSPMEIAF